MADKSINLVRTIADYENYLREFVLNMFEWRQERKTKAKSEKTALLRGITPRALLILA